MLSSFFVLTCLSAVDLDGRPEDVSSFATAMKFMVLCSFPVVQNPFPHPAEEVNPFGRPGTDIELARRPGRQDDEEVL